MKIADARRMIRETGTRVFVEIQGLNDSYLLCLTKSEANELIRQTSVGLTMDQSGNILIIRKANNQQEAIKPRMF